MTTEFDMVIIGSGPAGVHAAVQAAKLGKTVAIVEKVPDKLGGAWIHTGTIPSKTLRETLANIQAIKFHVGNDWVQRIVHDISAQTVFGRAQRVAQQEESVVREYLRRNKVELIEGFGQLEDCNHVKIRQGQDNSRTVRAERILIATGSRPRRPGDIPFDGWRVVDSDDILKLESVPKRLIIFGAGVIGCEYACIFNALGVDVTVVDGRQDIMQMVDRETADELKSMMEDDGIRFVLGRSPAALSVNGPEVTIHFDNDDKLSADLYFFAAGRVSCTDNLGLEQIGVDMGDRGVIKVNEHFQTSIANIYAVGDAIGAPALAATSAEQGRYASCHAFGSCDRGFPEVFPVGVYTIPEMSSVGRSEEDLKKANIDYEVGRAHFSEVARGYIRGDHKGLLKILVCKRSLSILGIHIVGPDACNLIHTGLSVMLYNGTVKDLVDRMIFNYPTLAETYRIAAFNALNKIFPDGVFEPGDGKTGSSAA